MKIINFTVLENCELSTDVVVETTGSDDFIKIKFLLHASLNGKQHKIEIKTPTIKKYVFPLKEVIMLEEPNYIEFIVKTDLFVENGIYFIGYKNEDGGPLDYGKVIVKNSTTVPQFLIPRYLPIENVNWDALKVVSLLEDVVDVYYENETGKLYYVKKDGEELVFNVLVEKIEEIEETLETFVVKNDTITGATKPKITYDEKGLVTAGEDLTADDIPELAQSKITNLSTDLENKVVKNDTITGATKPKITYDEKGLVTAGEDLTADDIPALAISKITDLSTTLSSIDSDITTLENTVAGIEDLLEAI